MNFTCIKYQHKTLNEKKNLIKQQKHEEETTTSINNKLQGNLLLLRTIRFLRTILRLFLTLVGYIAEI